VRLEDLARGAVAEAAPGGVVEPVGEPPQTDPSERPALAVAGRKRLTRPFAFSTLPLPPISS
jgi:hypothetical protein